MSTSRGTAASWTSRWGPPIGWAGVILVLTSWPSPRISTAVTGSDKVAHFSVYAILGFLVARALSSPRTRYVLFVALVSIYLFGMLDEVHQMWIPNRDASIWDWAADVLGSTTGLFVGHHLLSLAQTRQDLPT